MINRRTTKALAVTAALGFAATGAISSANAAVFDFTAIADGGSFTDTNNAAQTGAEGDWGTIVGSGVGILAADGVSVIGTGTNSPGTNTVDSYFDAGSAGLGVCSGFNGSQCDPGNDDNIGAQGGSGNVGDGSFETLILTFNQMVSLSQVVFAGEGHNEFHGDVLINGVSVDVDALGNHVGGHSILSTMLTGTSFSFQYIPELSGTTNEFYIGGVTARAVVPLPAGIVLLLSGLLGLGFMGRSRKSA